MTDHNLLISLRDIKGVGGCLAHWTLYLQQFNFTWEHQVGKHHSNANAMSHLPPTNAVLGVFQQLSPNNGSINTAQHTDKILSPIISTLANRSPLPADVAPGLRHSILEDGVLCGRFHPVTVLLMLPPHLGNKVQIHEIERGTWPKILVLFLAQLHKDRDR